MSKKEVKPKVSKVERKSRVSKSGKFRNLRHLVETLIAANKDITQDKVDAAVKKEFPDSSYITNPTGTHFPWYRCHIVNHGRFTQIDTPSWAKGLDKQKKKLKTDLKEKPAKEKEKQKKVKSATSPLIQKTEKKKKLKEKIKPLVDIDDVEEPKIKKKKLIAKEVGPTDEELAQLEMDEGEN